MKERASVSCSVIMPTYNRALLLANSLVALRQQTYPPDLWELIVVDDGSEDETPMLMRSFQAPFRVRYVRLKRSGNRAVVRNIGLERATGEVVIFIDAECLCPPHLIATHATLHATHPRLVICGAVKQVAFNGPPEVVERSFHRIEALPALPNSVFPRQESVTYLDFITAHASCRRRHLLEAGMFDEGFMGYGYEDTDLGYRLFLMGLKLTCHPDLIVYHQRHPYPSQARLEMKRNEDFLRRKHFYQYRVLHVLDHFRCGGTEKQVLLLAKFMQGRQFQLAVASLRLPEFFIDEFARLQVPLLHVPPHQLPSFIAQWRPHLIHYHDWGMPGKWTLFGLGYGPPIVVTVSQFTRTLLHSGIKKVVLIAPELKAWQAKVDDRFCVIEPGIDLDEFAPRGLKSVARQRLGLPDDALVVGTAARLMDDKVSPRMFEWYLQLARQHPDIYVVLLGRGKHLTAFRQRAAEAGLSERVLLPGPQEDMATLWEAFDLCGHFVEQEAFGLAVVEAMAKGIPVVAPSLSGLRRTVRDGVTGFLGQTPDELLERVTYLLTDTDLRKRMGMAAREHAKQFDAGMMAFRYKLVYDMVLCGARYRLLTPATGEQ